MGGSAVPPSPARLARALPVTRREAEVLALVASGLSNAEIARELSIRVGTVVKHLEHLYPKLGVTSRGSATAIALSGTVAVSNSASQRSEIAEALVAALPITRREAEVLACVAAGLTNADIAGELSIRVGTVVKHLEHLYPKLGVTSRSAAIAVAFATL